MSKPEKLNPEEIKMTHRSFYLNLSRGNNVVDVSITITGHNHKSPQIVMDVFTDSISISDMMKISGFIAESADTIQCDRNLRDE